MIDCAGDVPVVITPLQVVRAALISVVRPVDEVPHLIPKLTSFVGIVE